MSFLINPFLVIARNFSLIMEMARRDVVGRYRGSALGLLWSMFNPLFMLAVYTFAFGVLFKSRWPGGGDSKSYFAIVLFSGLLNFNFFTEVVNRAPSLISENANYVKKVVFPLEVLPVVAVFSGVFHLFVGLLVWAFAFLLSEGTLNPHILAMPFISLPLVFFTLGFAWFLASLGVYLKDVRQVVGVVTSGLIFLAPVFYPIESIPKEIRGLIDLNPLTHFVDISRSVMMHGVFPDPLEFFSLLAGSVLFSCLCLAWFQMTRKGFADVI